MKTAKEKDINDYIMSMLNINEYEKMRKDKRAKEKDIIQKTIIQRFIKICYEKKYNTQKYEDSILCNTFEDLIIDIIQETSKQYEEKVKALEKCNLIYKRSYARECAINKQLKNKNKETSKEIFKEIDKWKSICGKEKDITAMFVLNKLKQKFIKGENNETRTIKRKSI